ncbi:MAG: phosphoribosylanthranilate isomerase [Chitinivibrionales bacterium]|nr:phosphoribosylanthranilate isomerase [Chitinivibrionales bacterium]
MPVRIKICGITRYEDAKTAVGLGVDALGFIFYPKSPRFVQPQDARTIIERLPPFVSRVGVFVDEDAEKVKEIVAYTGIDTLQLHGNETPRYCTQFRQAVIKAFRVGPGIEEPDFDRYPVNGFLLDTWDAASQGGTGKTFDWGIARRACLTHANIILAGGLGPSNLVEALDAVRPYGIDLNSGVEVKPGVKNPHKLHQAVSAARGWR